GTLHAQLPAEHDRQPRGDGQPQSGAAVAARRRTIGLLEGLEDAPLHLRCDADAGVADGEVKKGVTQRRKVAKKRRRGFIPCVFARDSSAFTSTTTSPRSVNLTALLTRLVRICRRRVGSPRSASGTASSM